tara:strand:- start:216 stop:941 length:726 start_codon:yes stop_codon:yes gene_type:complete
MNPTLIPLERIIPTTNIKGLKKLEEISEMDESPEFCDWTSPWNWKSATPQFFIYPSYFLDAGQAFQEQIIVDLGSGLHLDNYFLAKIFDARSYIAVDKYNARTLFDKFEKQDEQNKVLRNDSSKLSERLGKLKDDENTKRLKRNLERLSKGTLSDIPATIIAEDMFNLLKRLPNDSVSILTGRIDKCMIPESENDYAQEIESQISRVLHPKGAHISFYSRFEDPSLIKHEIDMYYSRFTKR